MIHVIALAVVAFVAALGVLAATGHTVDSRDPEFSMRAANRTRA